MNNEQLWHLIEEVKNITKHDSFVVIGSLSILGYAERNQVELPYAMCCSMDLDFYPELDPESGFLVTEKLGEHSAFDLEYGYHADPVTPQLPTFPDGWEKRLLRIKENQTSATVCFTDPCDTAVSKYIRGEERDRSWCKGGIAAKVLDPDEMAKRFSMVTSASQEEVNLARDRFKEDLMELNQPLPKDVYFLDESDDESEMVLSSVYLDSGSNYVYIITDEDGLYHYTRYIYDSDTGNYSNEIDKEDYIYSDLETFIQQNSLTLIQTENEKDFNDDPGYDAF